MKLMTIKQIEEKYDGKVTSIAGSYMIVSNDDWDNDLTLYIEAIDKGHSEYNRYKVAEEGTSPVDLDVIAYELETYIRDEATERDAKRAYPAFDDAIEPYKSEGISIDELIELFCDTEKIEEHLRSYIDNGEVNSVDDALELLTDEAFSYSAYIDYVLGK